MARSKVIVVFVLLFICGCGNVFPSWPANFFEESPAELGKNTIREFRIEIENGADGSPTGVTVFAPRQPEGELPALVWVMGSNVQAYYHQSLHETLASWGYAVIVPDTRPLTFTDFQYHRRIMDLAKQALDLAIEGEFQVRIDESKLAVGGYSIGGTLSALVAAEDPRVDAIVFWAPSGSPFWTGVNPERLYTFVTQPTYYLLGEFDNIAPPDGFPTTLQEKLSSSMVDVYVIPQGLHLYFQQPTGADSPFDPGSNLTRFEQQGIAIERTRKWLDEQFNISREENGDG